MNRLLRTAAFAALLLNAALLRALEFVDATESGGIRFQHVDGRSGRRYFIETLGSGVAWFDYDNDGDTDLYFVNGSRLPGDNGADVPTNHLFRNEGDGTFSDVTGQAGVGDTGYGHGCCVGDYDRDGDLDLYVTNYGRNVLYRNNGDGTFSDVTDEAGVAEPLWSTSCAFADYDRDGNLDLFVTNYIEFDIETNPWCGLTDKGVRAYCEPNDFHGQPNALYRNNSDGTFTNVTRDAGLYRTDGKGLGVAWGDYDNDGYPDIYIANDSTENFLYRNHGDGTFEDVGMMAGVSLSENGVAENGMGTAWGDYDNDGKLDLVVTNYANQMNTLYHNDGDGFFSDVSVSSQTGPVSLPFLGWSTEFADVDNDGWLDLFVANGHLHDNLSELGQEGTYGQRNLLFHNNGDGTFTDVSPRAGVGLRLEEVTRGAAFADYDDDGDLDIALSNSHGAARLLRNDTPRNPNWIRMRFATATGERGGIGTRVTLRAGTLRQTQEVRSGSGYCSQGDLTLHFGLAEHKVVDEIHIRWATGAVERYENLPVNAVLVFTESRGYVTAPPNR
jgi:hypothetical protein